MALPPFSGTGSSTYPEFQQQTSSETTFALLALNGTSRIRGFHFPSELYSRLVTCIRRTWPEGMEWATLQSDNGWDCLLRGTPWKKKGTEEVGSIRLILALLETLSAEGWNLVQDVNVGSAKKDVHNFVFRHDGFPDASDKFFAITFPLANRISLVDPSSSCTPALISSIRSAILQPDQSSDVLLSPKAIRTDHSSPKLGFGEISKALSSSTRSTAGQEPYGVRGRSGGRANASGTDKQLKIKEEGWVGTGVYGFELSGYSVFAGRGTSDFKYDSTRILKGSA
ncbi:hypothetical protein QFC20_000177 [Naganishia adeliensis]|uniref:Uncharacterized protein n=1 Tax=Naganishia adeliensis TaxID=92952 RepID=A0ACC2X4C6_9TREE|nr:hypothetical protein QFC20_000177 [Naganishia adeliensis]